MLNTNDEMTATARTKEDKIALSRKRILKAFKATKERLDKFDERLNGIINDNQMGLTKDEVLSAFTSEEASELNRIKNEFKTTAGDIG